MIEDKKELSELINSGISLIPVIASEKKPYAPYKGKPSISYVDLIHLIDFYDKQSGYEECVAVAIRCGLESVGLVCLDIDSKHNAGFSERIYFDIQNLYPSIFDKLEIDRTPSGGLHFYYRINWAGGDGFPRSSNLASRICNQEELLIRPDLKKRCFIEFKGEGGLCQCYPSRGYTKVKRAGLVGIELLSQEEHSCLIALCGLYDETSKEIEVKSNKSRDSIYLDGFKPYDEFNASEKGADVLEELGWKFHKKSGNFDTYIRPGKKNKEVGASFNRDKRTYAIYTTNSSLDVACYNPSSLLCKEKFNGDWSQLGQWLVSLGYGKLKPVIEKSEVKKAIKSGIEELPANFSEDAKEQFRIGKEKRGKENPYGEFWTEKIAGDGEIKYEISREAISSVARELGFRNHKEKPVFIDGNLVRMVDSRFFFDYLKTYIGKDANRDLLDEYEDFLQKSGKFTIERLDLLDVSGILVSSKYVSYKFYRNCYVCVTAEGVEILDYEKDLKQYIWAHDKKDRDFFLADAAEIKKSLYWEFIKNAIGWSEYLMKCIGFYAHDYRDEESYLVITTEKSENEKDGGRCGKNIFWKLFAQITTFKSTAASMIKKDNQLLQSWNYERIFILSDIPKNFDLIFFKDLITDGAVVRKLYKDEFVADVHEMAKLGGSSNYTFDDSDPGVKGRLRLVEFTPYYKEKGGVKNATGKMFPKDWDSADFLYFDNIMLSCIQEYLIGDCIIKENEISDGGWNKKFEGMYKHLYNFIKDNIDIWVKIGRVSNKSLNDAYRDFRFDSNIAKALTSFTINRALTDYCEKHNIPFVFVYRKKNGELSDGVTWTENSGTVRGRFFGHEASEFLRKGKEVGIEEVKKVELIEDLPF